MPNIVIQACQLRLLRFRMYGAVGGALSDGRPYPYRRIFSSQ